MFWALVGSGIGILRGGSFFFDLDKNLARQTLRRVWAMRLLCSLILLSCRSLFVGCYEVFEEIALSLSVEYSPLGPLLGVSPGLAEARVRVLSNALLTGGRSGLLLRFLDFASASETLALLLPDALSISGNFSRLLACIKLSDRNLR